MKKYLSLILVIICAIIVALVSCSRRFDYYLDNGNKNNKLNIDERDLQYLEVSDGYISITQYNEEKSKVEKKYIKDKLTKKNDLLTSSNNGNFVLEQKNMGVGSDRIISLNQLKSYNLKENGYQIISENDNNILLQVYNHNEHEWTLKFFNKHQYNLLDIDFSKTINKTNSEVNEGISLEEKTFIFLFREEDGTYLCYVNDQDVKYTKISDEIMRDIKLIDSDYNHILLYKGYKEGDNYGISYPKIISLAYDINNDKLVVNTEKVIELQSTDDLNGSDCVGFVRKDNNYYLLLHYRGVGLLKLYKFNESGEGKEIKMINQFDLKKVVEVNKEFKCFDGQRVVTFDLTQY
ncbi:hypothetical protein [Vallitalea sp.]|jgi:uncharacterized protein YxeA|uniref:hypothetical protein n=1 Tax=Vallitalea sp. TaxID=1882829 RepID=UPI0025DD092B|nr:hypothetical protein [Vallitalea sp.]MCT4687327.1 hypothetical protein [Vallitalea sp.]